MKKRVHIKLNCCIFLFHGHVDIQLHVVSKHALSYTSETGSEVGLVNAPPPPIFLLLTVPSR